MVHLLAVLVGVVPHLFEVERVEYFQSPVQRSHYQPDISHVPDLCQFVFE